MYDFNHIIHLSTPIWSWISKWMLGNVTFFTFLLKCAKSALLFKSLCLDLEKYFSVFGKVFFLLKKCLHSLAKTLPRFSNNQKLTQCSGASLIALYKSLFKVGQTISNNLLQTNLPAKNNEGFAQVQPILKA